MPVRALVKAATVLVALTVLAGGAYWTTSEWHRLFPNLQRLPPDPDCDLRKGACARALPGGGSVRLKVSPEGIPLMTPLSLEVAIDGIEVDGIQVDIRGLNMEMGVNRTRLDQVSRQLWRGGTLLPMCSLQTMRWEAAVWLESGGAVLAVPYHFATRRHLRN